MLNIYLDIDGVLRGCASPKEDREALLRYILDHCRPFWLTTHCKHGVNNAPLALSQEFAPELVAELAQKVQPTDWGSMKTEAIDFDQDFLWLDDTLFQVERMILRGHGAIQNIIVMNPRNPLAAQRALQIIKARVGEI
ncbi:hypothetical protein IJ847_00455 [Candidatus Saccharibacteria bacterium]|nr:hypothetical protein [Candidatus Saccharibacteria bacterium]